jgi:L-threonylcarbamoyladenylate synthase
MTNEDVRTFERCIAVGGVALFPADTVYGLATEPDSKEGVRRLYALKGRSVDQPSAVMFFRLELALDALPELPTSTREAVERLLPGPVTVLVPNPARRFPLACGTAPEVLGVRVPTLEGELTPMGLLRWPVLQSSANLSGQPEARRLDEVDPEVRNGVDLLLDGGELPGTPSTVIDLTSYDRDSSFAVVREGAMSRAEVERALAGR